MRILRIGGRNLASLAGDFCADFEQEPLASAGLFAISGPTGAGKSTLLDALCLALYDATPRLLRVTRGGSVLPDVGDETVPATDPRNLLRRGTSEAFAEVDFAGSDQERYRARWSVRRSRNKVGGRLQDAAMTLHRLADGIAIGGTKTETLREIEQRVGLSFEQFTRAVLLAQNEFSAFLKTEENERGALLETLTGSTIYTQLSKRAFERFRQEERITRELSERLAYHTPLDAEARALLDAERSAADAVLAQVDARRALLEQQLRWHDEADKLRASESDAAQELATRLAAAEQAAPRHAHLARLDAVQAARPLQAECARVEQELASTRALGTVRAAELQAAMAAHEAAKSRTAAAAEALQAAEAKLAGAAPALNQARALDASIGALAPGCDAARAAAQQALSAAQAARMAVQTSAEHLDAARHAEAAASAWLAQHQPWEALSTQWPRWDALFAQAAEASSHAANVAAALREAGTKLDEVNARESGAGKTLEAAALALQAREAARQVALAALGQFDQQQLRTDRETLERERAELASAQALWRELADARTQSTQLAAQDAQIRADLARAESTLAAASAAEATLGATLGQAERSLGAAELACADSVTDLRATLSDGEPCPVCGSAAHPYHHQNDVLSNMLESLRDEVRKARAAVRENLAASAGARTLIAASTAQLAAVGTRAAEAVVRADQTSQAWAAHPLAQEATDPAWFSTRQQALASRQQALDAQEQALRRASAARDTAQQDCDAASASHARLQAALTELRTAQAQSLAAHAALVQQNAHAQSMPAAYLRELDAALAGHWPDWRDAWRADPAAFRAARDGEARQWREHAALQRDQSTAIFSLQSTHAAAAQVLEQREQAAAGAQAHFAGQDSQLAAMRAERMALWEGRAVSEIEAEMAGAIAAARAALANEHAALALAAASAERARADLANNAARLEQLDEAAQAARTALVPWLDKHPDLQDLLACQPDWLAQERAALQAIGKAVEQAAAVQSERRERRAQHEALAPAADRASVQLALEQVAIERQSADSAAAALRLRAAQDDERRGQAQAVLAEIEAQQQIERRWGRMNELIGSADGKKFRNYAQQFTLDVLLGYANSHLGQLAKRYRLERVTSAAGPSLALLVRDQDMGGEIRSVNSLSGGESFLVSLALALGLASMSSNRVRVESLFIDEGFGSLDSDTLRVAMDALDGLQSMGRKVGVISHVQEMTERIATRIVVQPSGGGSSRVAVE